MLTRRRFLGSAIAGLSSSLWLPSHSRAAAGAFQPSWSSLAQYRVPEWFRVAKFGIWAHWSAQCVPEQGDWYARLMYQQGEPAYEYHVKHYGHPTTAQSVSRADGHHPGRRAHQHGAAAEPRF